MKTLTKEEILAGARMLIRDGFEWVTVNRAELAMQSFSEQENARLTAVNEKQAELIIVLTEALDFLADNNLIKERKDNSDTDNKPLIDCVNKSAKLRDEIAALEKQPTAMEMIKKAGKETKQHCKHQYSTVRYGIKQCADCGKPLYN